MEDSFGISFLGMGTKKKNIKIQQMSAKIAAIRIAIHLVDKRPAIIAPATYPISLQNL